MALRPSRVEAHCLARIVDRVRFARKSQVVHAALSRPNKWMSWRAVGWKRPPNNLSAVVDRRGLATATAQGAKVLQPGRLTPQERMRLCVSVVAHDLPEVIDGSRNRRDMQILHAGLASPRKQLLLTRLPEHSGDLALAVDRATGAHAADGAKILGARCTRPEKRSFLVRTCYRVS